MYEEAIQTVVTVRDFTQVFDAYAQFEEGMIAAKMEATAETGATEDGKDIYLTLQQSSVMMWTIQWKSYLGIHVINCLHITFPLTSLVSLHICMLLGVRENAYCIVCHVRWVFSRHLCLNPVLSFQARAGFGHLCKEKLISHSKQCHRHIIYTCTVQPVFRDSSPISQRKSLHDRCPFKTGALTSHVS